MTPFVPKPQKKKFISNFFLNLLIKKLGREWNSWCEDRVKNDLTLPGQCLDCVPGTKKSFRILCRSCHRIGTSLLDGVLVLGKRGTYSLVSG